MTVGATMDDPQELLNTARRHCQAIQTIIDRSPRLSRTPNCGCCRKGSSA